MKQKLKKILLKYSKLFVAFGFFFSVFVFSGCLKSSNPAYKIDLEVWGIFDSSDILNKISSDYKDINSHIGEIRYKKLTVDNYKKDLIDALASGQGPDIFLISNTWAPSFQDKIEPAPEIFFPEKEFRETFVDVVVNDFLIDKKVYASPLSVDSLALYWNKDLFNAQGIVAPPATWNEFNEAVKKLTRINQNDEIIQSGAAFGTAYNVNRSTDILTLLMLQNGANMTNGDKTEATFDKVISSGNATVRSGENALEYYTQFAKRDSSLYSWNPRMHYSIDSFYEGTTAMMINYSWHYNTIKNKNSKINFAVAPIPQLYPNNPLNYSNYWGFTVSKSKIMSPNLKKDFEEKGISESVYGKLRTHESWEFLRYLTMKNDGSITLYNGINGNNVAFPLKTDPAEVYIQETQKPAARRDLVEKQKNDPILSPFAYGNIIARSWYQKDPESIEKILAETIDSVNLGKLTVYDALKLGANRVGQLMRK